MQPVFSGCLAVRMAATRSSTTSGSSTPAQKSGPRCPVVSTRTAFMEAKGLLRPATCRADAGEQPDELMVPATSGSLVDMAMTQPAPRQDCLTTSGSLAAASGPG